VCPIINFFEYHHRARGSDLDYRHDFPSLEMNVLRARTVTRDPAWSGGLCRGIYADAVAMESFAGDVAAQGRNHPRRCRYERVAPSAPPGWWRGHRRGYSHRDVCLAGSGIHARIWHLVRVAKRIVLLDEKPDHLW